MSTTNPRANPLTTRSDEELVRNAQAAGSGDTRAFAELVRRYEGRIAANCLHISGSPDDVPDLKQEVFVRAYFALRRFEGRSQFSTWLWRIKINRCLRFVERKRPLVDYEDEGLDDPALRVEATADLDVESSETAERVRSVLQSMPDGARIPLILRDMDGLAYEEIAGRLGLSLSATKMRILRARESFRSLYSAIDPDKV